VLLGYSNRLAGGFKRESGRKNKNARVTTAEQKQTAVAAFCPGGIRKSTFHGPWHWQSAARRPLLQAEFITPSAPIILAIIPQSRKTLTSLRRGKSTTYNGSGGKTREKTVWPHSLIREKAVLISGPKR